MTAKDIMKTRIVKAAPDWTVAELARTLTDRRVSGMPVVDARGCPVGVVTQTDIVRQEREKATSTVDPWYHDMDVPAMPRGWQPIDADRRTVRDIMTPTVLQVEESTPVAEVARRMLRSRVHRVFVSRRGRLVGVISSTDLVRCVAEGRR